MVVQERLSWSRSFSKALKSMSRSLPTIIGVVLLIGVFKSVVTPDMITSLFSGSGFLDSLIGSLAGSVMTGNAMTSYVIGGELSTQGVSLIAITAFLVCWTTVGLVQLPAEREHLGLRFSIARNILSFLLSFVVAIVTVAVVNLL